MEFQFKSRNRRTQSFKIYCAFGIMSLFTGLSACKKAVEIDSPVTQITAATLYSNNTSAAAVMTGIYSNMIARQTGLSSGNASIGYYQGAAADELTNYNATDVALSQFYTNSLSSSAGGSSSNYYWPELYNEIHVANAVIDGLATHTGVTPAMKQQLTGEALFMRAFLHFYAVNLYGDVPLVTTTNYLVNNAIKRSPVNVVYQQIIQDLKDAQNDLSDNFVSASGLTTTHRVRPNKGAAMALLARVYLYYGNLTGDASNYTNAAAEASNVISNSQYNLVSDLNNVFLANSTETIWQLEPNTPGFNTFDGYAYVLTSPPGPAPFEATLSNSLVKTFEPGDKRYTKWVGTYTPDNVTFYYYPNKYKIGGYNPGIAVTEYTMALRLAEQYLIRAEAEVHGAGNGIAGANTDLNTIRNRAGLANYSGPADQNSVLAAILHERQVELFTEWGHRWFDLKRTGNINSVMGSPGNECAAKGGTWNANWALLPLPLPELQINSNLTQNPGY